MLIYLFKSTCILGLLLIFYRLFLERETIHHFKRFFLLGAVLLAVVIPAISFTSYVEAVPNSIETIENATFKKYEPATYTVLIKQTLWAVYFLGVLLFGFRFFKNLRDLYLKIRSGQKIKSSRYIYVLLNQLVTPHTFLHYIFFERSSFKNQQIPQALKVHEETHASQLHSADILFIELLIVLFWFNPLLYVLKKYVQLNHEFIADQAVLNADVQLENYQELLLQYTTHSKYAFANAINYSSIKKRFTIMKTKTPPKILWFKGGLLALFITVLTLSFSTKKEIELEAPIEAASKKVEQQFLKKTVDQRQDKASPEQVAEYNRLAKSYNDQDPQKMVVKLKDVEKMKYIYNLMTAAQKKAAQPFPELPPPPPPAPKKNWANQGTKKLQEFAKKFFHKTDSYLISLKQFNSGKKNYKEVKSNYEETILAYERYAKQADAEGITIPPPPPPAPKDQRTKTQGEASSKMMKEYIDKTKGNQIKISHVDRVKHIYSLMSNKQKAEVSDLNKLKVINSKIKLNNGWSVEAGVSDVQQQDIIQGLPIGAKYFINGKETTRAKVLKLDVDDIESIHVKKKEGTNGAVYIKLK